MRRLRGLTWGHRRAIEPLRASAEVFRQRSGVEVEWRVRSLQEFEHQSFEEAVRSTDLIVFDHPHIGDVVSKDLLRPLQEIVGDHLPLDDRTLFVGASLASYQAWGATWAVPVDGATIHSVYRADLLAAVDACAPVTWRESIDLLHRLRRAGMTGLLAARGHHLLLTMASLMGNIGAPWRGGAHARSIALDRDALGTAIDLVEEALAAGDRARSLASDAIDVHEALAREPHAAFCPAAYGYATYGEAGLWPHRLAFGPFPGSAPVACAATVLGGAGVGITRACSDLNAAARYLVHLWQPSTQLTVFAASSGQPARTEAWCDPVVDSRFNGFFSSARATIEAASVRPRFAGYPVVEQELATTLHRHLSDGLARGDCIDLMMAQAAGEGRR